MANIIFNSVVSGHTTVIPLQKDEHISGQDVYELVSDRECIPTDLLSISSNGKNISRSSDELLVHEGDVLLQVCIACIGGKGGFGSMLRAIGAQIEKTTNKDACRDLSGRRLRDVNAEKKIKEYIAKQAKRKEQENKKRKEKLERLRRQPKIEFKDEEYFKSRSELPELVDDAVSHGMKKVLAANQKRTTAPSATITSASTLSAPPDATESTSTTVTEEPVAGTSGVCLKRKDPPSLSTAGQKKKQLKCLWLGVDEDVSSDEE